MAENSLFCLSENDLKNSPMTQISENLSGTKISSNNSFQFKKRKLINAFTDITNKYTNRQSLGDITNKFNNNSLSLFKNESPKSHHDSELSLFDSHSPLSNSCTQDLDYEFDSGISSQENDVVQFLEPAINKKKIKRQIDFDLSQDSLVKCLDNTSDIPININDLVNGDILTTPIHSTSSSSNKLNYTLSDCLTPVNSSRARNRLFSTSPSKNDDNLENSFKQIDEIQQIGDEIDLFNDFSNENKLNRLFSLSPLKNDENCEKIEESDFFKNFPNEEILMKKIPKNKLLKRCQSLIENTDQLQIKRYKTSSQIEGEIKTNKCFRRSISTCSPNSIMLAVQRSEDEPNLIGDFSKSYILPLISGRHCDLQSISPLTLAKLIRGEFSSKISSYKIIDCRYPYEYSGGHIRGALNYFTKELIETELLNKNPTSTLKMETEEIVDKRENILIFHCEFSAHRAPFLFRHLRKVDRTSNTDAYPNLHYPEVYLLDGGYKRFFSEFSDLCEPKAYQQMNDPAHEHELRQFRSLQRTGSSTFGKKLSSKLRF